ncbi:MAG: anti-sigma factor family protein [Gemmatimonadota bacterium]
MRCGEIGEKLSCYVDGELRGDEARALEEHLAACGACRRLAGRMRILDAGIGRTEALVPSDFRETVFARLEREELLPRRRSLFAYAVRWAAVPLAAAAALALFVIASRDAGVKGPAPAAKAPSAAEARAPRAGSAPEPRVARQAPETSTRAAGTGVAATAVARAGADLTPEERDIVAHLDVLEDPAAFDEPSDIDDLEIVEPGGGGKG